MRNHTIKKVCEEWGLTPSITVAFVNATVSSPEEVIAAIAYIPPREKNM